MEGREGALSGHFLALMELANERYVVADPCNGRRSSKVVRSTGYLRLPPALSRAVSMARRKSLFMRAMAAMEISLGQTASQER